MLLLLLSACLGVSARILEHREPKVDPISLENVVNRIVDSSMDDLRFRIRQAIYTLALRQNSDLSTQNLNEHEELLLQQFLSQLRKQSDVPVQNPDSHTMSIALETHTVDPLLTHRENKLVTAHQRQFDDQPLVDESPFPWIIAASCSATVILFLLIVLISFCIRRQRRRKCSGRLARIPGTFTISAMCLPEHAGPGAFLERMRSEESVWTTAGGLERSVS